jgi:hypothetical protein
MQAGTSHPAAVSKPDRREPVKTGKLSAPDKLVQEAMSLAKDVGVEG